MVMKWLELMTEIRNAGILVDSMTRAKLHCQWHEVMSMECLRLVMCTLLQYINFNHLEVMILWFCWRKKLHKFVPCSMPHLTAITATQPQLMPSSFMPPILLVLLKAWFQSGRNTFISKSPPPLKESKGKTKQTWSKVCLTEPQWRFTKGYKTAWHDWLMWKVHQFMWVSV